MSFLLLSGSSLKLLIFFVSLNVGLLQNLLESSVSSNVDDFFLVEKEQGKTAEMQVGAAMRPLHL